MAINFLFNLIFFKNILYFNIIKPGLITPLNLLLLQLIIITSHYYSIFLLSPSSFLPFINTGSFYSRSLIRLLEP